MHRGFVQNSKILHMKKLAKAIKRHWNGILNWFDNKISNGKVEANGVELQKLKDSNNKLTLLRSHYDNSATKHNRAACCC